MPFIIAALSIPLPISPSFPFTCLLVDRMMLSFEMSVTSTIDVATTIISIVDIKYHYYHRHDRDILSRLNVDALWNKVTKIVIEAAPACHACTYTHCMFTTCVCKLYTRKYAELIIREGRLILHAACRLIFFMKWISYLIRA